jgi:hypothetical protein
MQMLVKRKKDVLSGPALTHIKLLHTLIKQPNSILLLRNVISVVKQLALVQLTIVELLVIAATSIVLIVVTISPLHMFIQRSALAVEMLSQFIN